MTQKNIGPSFANELAAAGLSGKPFSWTESGDFTFSPDMPQAERDAVLAVYAAHNPDNLNPYRDAAALAIDAAAENARGRFITTGSGQAMVYQAKTQEAAAWLAAGSPPGLTNFPFIAAEVGITAPTAADLVALWQTMEAGWRHAAAQIEAARMAGKIAVQQAGDVDGIEQARNQAIATLNTIELPEE